MASIQMTGIRKFEIQVGLTLLICALLLAGCNSLRKVFRIGTAQTGEVEKTLAEQRKAKLLKRIDRRFEEPETHFQLGQLYQLDGLWARAEHEYSITLSFDPAHSGAQAARVKVVLAGGDVTKAELLNDIYMEQVAHSAAGSLRLALAYQKQGLDEHALSGYQQALRLAPNSAKINRQIGYYYLSKNDKKQAVNYLIRSFQLNANQPEVARELGRLGVPAKRPRKIERRTRKLDKIVEKADKQMNP